MIILNRVTIQQAVKVVTTNIGGYKFSLQLTPTLDCTVDEYKLGIVKIKNMRKSKEKNILLSQILYVNFIP